MLSKTDLTPRRRRRFGLAALALLALLALTPSRGEATITTFHCVNPSGGAAWNLTVDDAGQRVDSYEAQITAATIAWHDAKDGGNYSLDRATGALTGAWASSTGGYFLHYTCKPG